MSGPLFGAGPTPSGERPGSRARPLRIDELNAAAQAALSEALGVIWVAGEISQLKIAASGHWYFCLRDDKASVDAVLFRGRAARLRGRFAEGDEVVVLATPGVYRQRGRFQLICDEIEARGAGAAAAALEALKERLAAEGLFDPAKRKPLPALPRRIGVVTSREGAAWQDVQNVLRRRFAGVTLVLAHASVQGERAPEELVDALFALDAAGVDVLLLVRGGGAREDLAAFDDERVVRAVSMVAAPLVSGVGHEIDTTLVDLAADLRAPTPSAAAELVVRERLALVEQVGGLSQRLSGALERRLTALRLRLAEARGRRGLGLVPRLLGERQLLVDEHARRLEDAARRRLRGLERRVSAARARLDPSREARRMGRVRRELEAQQARLEELARAGLARRRGRAEVLAARLDALSPLAVLARGYAIVTDEEGRVLRRASESAPGRLVRARLGEGRLEARVEAVDNGARSPGADPPPRGSGGSTT